jgi:hypothetical protein
LERIFSLLPSQQGMDIEATQKVVSPLIEEPVFVLAGPSDLHFPPPLNLLMAEGAEESPLACQAFTDSARLELDSREMHLRTSS